LTRTSISPVASFGFGHALGAGGDDARHRDDPLRPQLSRLLVHGLAAQVRVEHELGQAVAVAEVDEHEPAVVAVDVDPARRA
jgi:hypothetical protein